MDTDALRWLQQVADGTTVTEVSELESVTQSGVSRALARLEEQIGTPLLRRSGRTLRMTHAGAVFKPHLDAVLHHLDDGIAAVSQLIDPETGSVALAFQQSLGTWLVPDLARSFRATRPGVRFQLTQVRDELRSAPLDGGRADLELGTRRPGSEQPDATFRSRLIAIEPLRLALPREHRLAAQPRVRLADVATDPFIGLRPVSALRKRTDDLCEQAGFRPTVIFEGDDLSNVRGFVAAGLGVAVVPAPRAGSPESAAGPVVYAEIVDPGAVREIFLIWSAERRLLPAADLFRRHVLHRAAAGRLPAVSPLFSERIRGYPVSAPVRVDLGGKYAKNVSMPSHASSGSPATRGSKPSSRRPAPRRRAAEIDIDEARKAFFLMVGFIALIWVLQVVNWADQYRLDVSYGILPRDVARLPEIFIAPFLHFSWDHIEGNSGPLFVFGLLAAYRGVVRFLGVTALVALTSGLGVWLFQGNRELTVGASGLIFGYFGYVLARGVIDRNLIDALAAVVMGLSYAYILTVAIPGTPGVSWIGHLGGLVGGLAAGWIFRTRRGAPRRAGPDGPGGPGTKAGGSGRGPASGTVAVPVSPGHPRADLYKELGDLGL
jgi:DNA-binding transcriptional LysR family regulator/membrane associated rhomboid family serine protease